MFLYMKFDKRVATDEIDRNVGCAFCPIKYAIIVMSPKP